ncbi:MAG: multicopper oxidase domain-containing protein [Niastella sp.]|nr:multicopper oxidase domain-containing protein [Niastella sp.]
MPILFTIAWWATLLMPGKTGQNAIHPTQSIEKQGTFLFVIKDTTLTSGKNVIHSFSVNNLVPPKILELKLNELSSISFRNNTRQELILMLPTVLMPEKPRRDWVTITAGQTFAVPLQKNKTGVFKYHITRMEQKDNGVVGLMVIKAR